MHTMSVGRGESIANAHFPSTLRLVAQCSAIFQHQIHDALREQHPEWIEQNGDCPTCEFVRVALHRAT